MKTTVEINDGLLSQAKQVARDQGVPLRELLEAGLRREVEARSSRDQFRLRDASVDGSGLQGDLAQRGWQAIQDAAYEGRGA